jgi:hypothetical protein
VILTAIRVPALTKVMKRGNIFLYATVIMTEILLFLCALVLQARSWEVQNVGIVLFLVPFGFLASKIAKRLVTNHPGIDETTPLILIGGAIGVGGFAGGIVDISHTAPTLLLVGAYAQSLVLWFCSRSASPVK